MDENRMPENLLGAARRKELYKKHTKEQIYVMFSDENVSECVKLQLDVMTAPDRLTEAMDKGRHALRSCASSCPHNRTYCTPEREECPDIANAIEKLGRLEDKTEFEYKTAELKRLKSRILSDMLDIQLDFQSDENIAEEDRDDYEIKIRLARKAIRRNINKKITELENAVREMTV